ncbi:hypothetical protein WAI453_001275 [Rhynchosporium graminicola]|uniref:Uncharacterized protein n=1 Tax=Rhynchosporium graminicola TaxID=2792576 RepID=A0A1E1K702_9HELO|nr:uncharacterized protein RCO7_08039 [Rhynchosporium commune]
MSPFSIYAVALFGFVMRVNSYPSNVTLELSPPSQYEYKDPDTGALKPYVPFDFENWDIDSSLYEGVPMIIKTTVIDGKTLKFQDFDLEHLSVDQLRNYVFNGDEYLHLNGSHSLSDNEVEYLREVFVSRDLGIAHRGHGTQPRDLLKRGGLPNECWEYEKQNWCQPGCTYTYTRTTVSTINRSVYGLFHYEEEAICGPGTITHGVTRTAPASVAFSSKIDLQTWGRGFLHQATRILKDAGFSVTRVPDSVSNTYTYGGFCYPKTRCEMWYRPHFQVFKGVITLSAIASDQRTHCMTDQQSAWEAHTPLPNGVDGGPYLHGICQRRNARGCIEIRPNNLMSYCP